MTTLLDPGAKTELLDRLKRLTPETKAEWGKMIAPQMVCHLTDAFEMLMGQRATVDQGNAFTRSAFAKFGVLRVPLRWPHGAKAPREIDQAIGGTRPASFNQDVRNLTASLDQICAPERKFQFARHPLFGELTEWEAMRLGYLHVDHHLRQFGL